MPLLRIEVIEYEKSDFDRLHCTDQVISLRLVIAENMYIADKMRRHFRQANAYGSSTS
jgi:hypothetical protein